MEDYRYVINKLWNGSPRPDEDQRGFPIVQLKRGNDHVELRIEAPYYNDPKPTECPGPCFGLWEYEVVEAFFLASDSKKYLEVEFGPHGQHIILFLDGVRNIIKHSFPVKFLADIDVHQSKWYGYAEIPLSYFPPNVDKFNAYSIHGKDDSRQYNALYPVPGPQPDYHRIDDFQNIEFDHLVPENRGAKLSNVWEKAIGGQ